MAILNQDPGHGALLRALRVLGFRVVACDTVGGLRRLTGCTGALDEVYERIVSPQTASNVERYFEATRR